MNGNDIRRRVTGGATRAQLDRQPAVLFLAEHGGRLWASNRYWITPAHRVAPLLEQYNLDPGQPASFAVNSTVRKASESTGDVGRIIGKPEDYPDPIAPVRIGGSHACVRLSDRGPWLAAWQTADGTAMGIPGDDLAWLSCTHDLPHELDHHYGEVRLMSKGTGGKPVLLAADLIHVIKPGGYGTDPDTGRSAYFPAETENLGPRVIGAIMAVALGGA